MKRLHPALLALIIRLILAALMFIICLFTSFKLYVNLGGVIGLVIMALGGLFSGGRFGRWGYNYIANYEQRRNAVGTGLFMVIVGAPLIITSVALYLAVYSTK